MLKFLWSILTIVLSFHILPSANSHRVSSQCSATAKYRTFNGTCFNLKRPLAGSADSRYGRLYPPNYSDGIAAVRRSADGKELPGARFLSAMLSDHSNVNTAGLTLFIMQWGQFVDHDLADTDQIRSSDNSRIECCSNVQLGRFIRVPPPSPECLPIEIPSNDREYGTTRIKCMNFVRSVFEQPISNGPRQQKNSNTHWLDGSHIYGSSEEKAKDLRNPSANAGQLKTSSDSFNRVLLPLSNRCCPNDQTNSCPAAPRCFDAGDNRLNQHATLTSLHTIWLREHNRVANRLRRLYRRSHVTVDDDFLYQEARRIVVAELQHITYTEYLPNIIGREYADYVMAPRSNNDNFIKPSILQEFNTAAFRMGHSQAKSFIELFEPDDTLSQQSFFLADSLQQAGGPFFPDRQGITTNRLFIDNVMRGLLRSLAETVDSSITRDIHSRLFRINHNPLGFDLISINIQRGRDHGLPTYATVRGINTFEEMYPTTSRAAIRALKTMYASVHDIDLYVGGLFETPLPGASVGPTFANIIAKQFRILRVTDRFFYDDLSQSVSFTPKQLAEIQKTSLAHIICSNNDGTILNIQPNAFKFPNGLNAPTSCDNIPGINFNNWLSSHGYGY